MKCPVCHGELQDSSSFCPYCGTRLDWTGSTRTGSSPSKHIGAANGTTNNPVLSRIPDNVNQGDTIQLSLSFVSGNVVMVASDYNTGASSSHSYTAAKGTTFLGASSATTSRTPTSLMTEWYHPSPSETSMKQVTYSVIGSTIPSAWICIGEYVPPNSSSLVYAQCSSKLTLTSTFQQYSYHGLITYASNYQFQTGPS